MGILFCFVMATKRANGTFQVDLQGSSLGSMQQQAIVCLCWCHISSGSSSTRYSVTLCVYMCELIRNISCMHAYIPVMWHFVSIIYSNYASTPLMAFIDCILNCGNHGTCVVREEYSDYVQYCECHAGWMGQYCNVDERAHCLRQNLPWCPWNSPRRNICCGSLQECSGDPSRPCRPKRNRKAKLAGNLIT